MTSAPQRVPEPDEVALTPTPPGSPPCGCGGGNP